MRPISLEIKGLNSFIEPQKIDFEKLTKRGLFGIFGPTGSGKSTILDGITLALYGEVARKSTNFMNTNCESLHVSYEFQITEKEVKRYRVEREFRRDKKTEAVRTKSAKILSIEGETEVVLEEQVRPVTEKCEEIIGLKLEDFTRTVVLPQGNFSEFLKLEGKEKRNMLERLFNLQKYGDDLSFKLGRKIKKEKEKSHILEGELNGYEDVNEATLKEQKKTLLDTKETLSQYKNEVAIVEDSYNKGKEIWNLQIELKEETDKKVELKAREVEIKEVENSVKFGESALKVQPFIKSYESTYQEINDVEVTLQKGKEELDKLKEEKEKKNTIFEIAKTRKDKELPNLSLKRQRVLEAIEEDKVLRELIAETNTLNQEILEIEQELIVTSSAMEENKINSKKQSEEILDKEEATEKLKISEEYKQKISDGVALANSFENIEKQKDLLSREITILSSQIKKGKSERDQIKEQLEENNGSLEKLQEMLETLEKNSPGNQNVLMDMYNKLLVNKDRWKTYKEYLKVIEKAESITESYKKQLDNMESKKNSLKIAKEALSNQICEKESQSLAYTLRQNLLEGEVCPVCGSKEHHTETLKSLDFNDIEELKVTHKEMENDFQNLLSEITILKTNLETGEIQIREYKEKIIELGDEFKKVTAEVAQEEFDAKKAAVEEYDKKKTDVEKNIKELEATRTDLEINFARLNTSINEKEGQLEKLEKDLNEITKTYEETDGKIKKLKTQLDVEDFLEKREEIRNKEEQKSKLESEIKDLRIVVKELQDEGEVLSKTTSNLREGLQEKKTSYKEKSNNIKEKKAYIRKKIGLTEKLEDVTDLKELSREISISITKIEGDYKIAEEEKAKIEQQYNECSNKIISAGDTLVSLRKRYDKDKEELELVLKEENFKNIHEIREHLITKSEIQDMKTKIEKYKESLVRVTGSIETLNKKLDGKSLTEEEWLDIQNAKVETFKKEKELEEEMIRLGEGVKQLEKRLEEKKELLTRKAKLDHSLALLNDLEKLFKGKKFVEFVAANQLKYVSMEAGKKLKEITGGSYGLEVDENGKFLIRDYKNGGARRDATTLSGGETFLASLSLALALSAQIQLKGTTPLEFFFLDEGFGTLDDNLLEVVMDSLEKIHHDKLSIGIISHLEAIKSRIPVKLIVTPAEAGMGGSKVKIERS